MSRTERLSFWTVFHSRAPAVLQNRVLLLISQTPLLPTTNPPALHGYCTKGNWIMALDEFPSLLRVTRGPFQLPTLVTEAAENARSVCFMGLLPDLGLAWASADDRLFLWRPGRRETPLEHNFPFQAVSCVGCVKPVVGVFPYHIDYLLVVCTSVEIHLLGMTFLDTGFGFELEALPFYTCCTKGVLMTSVASTKKGRIFVSGNDGHLYEIKYRPRCSMACVTWRLRDYFIFSDVGGPNAMKQVIVDDARSLLYTLNRSGAVQAFQLGENGEGPAKKIADCLNFGEESMRAMGGFPVFRKETEVDVVGLRTLAVGGDYVLLAVTSDGHRVFFELPPIVNGGWFSGYQKLRPRLVKPAAKEDVINAQDPDAMTDGEFPVLQYSTCPGAVVLARSSETSTEISLIEALPENLELERRMETYREDDADDNRDGGRRPDRIMPLPDYTEKFRKRLMEIPGFAVSLQVMNSKRSGWYWDAQADGRIHSGELCAQIFLPRHFFTLVTSKEVVSFERGWPVDMLHGLLEQRAEKMNAIKSFFATFGRTDAAAMCFQILCSSHRSTDESVIRAGLEVLENVEFVGAPKLVGSADQVELECSKALRGLQTFLDRLFSPIWEQKLFKPEDDRPECFGINFTVEVVQWYQAKCADVVRGVDRVLAKRGGYFLPDGFAWVSTDSAKQQEVEKIAFERNKVKRAGDLMGLLETFHQHQVMRLTADMDILYVNDLRRLKFGDLVKDLDSDSAIQEVMLQTIQDRRERADVIIDKLDQCASSFFNKDKREFMLAYKLLQKAVDEKNAEIRRKLVSEAVGILERVPHVTELKTVIDLLFDCDAITELVNIGLKVASVQMPPHLTSAQSHSLQELAFQKKREAHGIVLETAKDLLEMGSEIDADDKDWKDKLQNYILAATEWNDKTFHTDLFDYLLSKPRGVEVLCGIDSTVIEKYLRKQADIKTMANFDGMEKNKAKHAEILAEFLARRGKFQDTESWLILQRLGERRDALVPLNERIRLLNKARQYGDITAKGDYNRLVAVCDLADLQKVLLDQLRNDASEEDLQTLETNLMSADNVNQYAQRHHMYDIAVRALPFLRQTTDFDDVCQLWQALLNRVAHEQQDPSHLCEVVADIGFRLNGCKLYFPDVTICYLLHSMIEPTPENLTLIAKKLLQGLVGDGERLKEVYKGCLADRSIGSDISAAIQEGYQFVRRMAE